MSKIISTLNVVHAQRAALQLASTLGDMMLYASWNDQEMVRSEYVRAMAAFDAIGPDLRAAFNIPESVD